MLMTDYYWEHLVLVYHIATSDIVLDVDVDENTEIAELVGRFLVEAITTIYSTVLSRDKPTAMDKRR